MHRRLLLQLPLLATLAACTPPGRPQPPRIRLVAFDPIEGTILGQSWRARLSVTNPGQQPMTIGRLTIELALDGRRFGRARSKRPIQLAAGETMTIVPRLQGSAMDQDHNDFMTLERRTEVDWALTGTVVIDGSRSGPLDYRETGTLRLGRRDAAGGIDAAGMEEEEW